MQGAVGDYAEPEEEPIDILEMDFIYREDGTLYYRDYHCNSYIFGTYEETVRSYYDEKERLVYENGYITSGYTEHYYIYLNDGRKP